MSSKKPSDVPRQEYAKTLWHVVIDLSVRVLSAVALVALGIAGWRLQSESQQQRLKDEQHDRLSRRYLPMYRTFSELELVLQDCAEELRNSKVGHERVPMLRECSYRLETASVSSFAPEAEPSADVVLPVLSAKPDALGVRPVSSINIPARTGALMISDLLRILALSESSMRGDERREAIVRLTAVRNEPTGLVMVPLPARDQRPFAWCAAVIAPGIRSESVRTWRRWNASGEVQLTQLSLMIGTICQAVHRQAISVNQEIMRERPELGDRFVDIRQAAVAQQASRRASRRMTDVAPKADRVTNGASAESESVVADNDRRPN